MTNTWNEPERTRATRSTGKFFVIMNMDCISAFRVSTVIRTYFVLIERNRKLATIEPRMFPKNTADSK